MHEHIIQDAIKGLAAGNWRDAVLSLRCWLHVHCPRYTRADVELQLGSVSGLLINRSQMVQRSKLDPKHFNHLDPLKLEAEWEAAVRFHLAEWPRVYARRCSAIDETPDAESKIEQTVRRIDQW